MTCEVAVLNKYAVVIAADSAVTYSNGSGEKRYSKGGNKIFQLSHHQPIGVMIYDSGSILGVPWELVIKEFRHNLAEAAFDTVAGYARSFVDYLKNNTRFFPLAERDEYFLSAVKAKTIRVLLDLMAQAPVVKDGGASVADRSQAWADFYAKRKESLFAKSLLSDLDADTESTYIANAVAGLTDTVTQVSKNLEAEGKLFVNDFMNFDQWIEIAALEFIRDYDAYNSQTGIVFCGYGTSQIFPEVFEINVAGFVGPHVIFKEGANTEISRERESSIHQFATTSMVDVFTQGYGFEIWSAVGSAFQEHSRALAESLLADSGASAKISDLDARLAAAAEKFRDQWTDQLFNSNYGNLRRNIGTLPVDEMVHLAETMIVLESLKEKVTSPSQSVGGPVDVAVITRNEGLVWVKRKHYFDAKNNPRFVMRQERLYR